MDIAPTMERGARGEHHEAPQRFRLALPFVFAILIVDAVIASLIYPVYSQFTRSLANPELWFGVAMLTFSAFQLVSAPILGALSDRVGRAPVFRLAAIGTFVAGLFLVPIRFVPFVANRAIDGTTNGLYGVAKSAITDLSDPDDVQRNVGLSTTVSYLGLLLGPGVASLVLWFARVQGWDSTRSLVVAGLVFAGVNVVLSLALPETRPPGARADAGTGVMSGTDGLRGEVSVGPTSIVGALRASSPIETWHRFRTLRHELPEVAAVIEVAAMLALCTGYYSYFAIFVARGPLQLDPQAVAIAFLYFAAVGIVANTVFFARIAKRLPTVPTLQFLFLVGIVSLVLYATSDDNLWWLYFALTIDMLSLSLAPGLVEGLIGSLAPEERRGEVFGVAQGLGSLMSVLSIVVYTVTSLIDLRLPFVFFAIPLVVAYHLSKKAAPA
jgi:MFS transporter, DHA1 family, tetracycline resistance protein